MSLLGGRDQMPYFLFFSKNKGFGFGWEGRAKMARKNIHDNHMLQQK